MKLRSLLAAVLVALSLPLQAATEVLPLNYRTAEDVLPVVQSVLGNDGRVNAYGNQLIINAEPAKIEEIRQLLNQLDTQPKRLLITVATQDSSSADDRGYQVDGSVSIGDVEVEAGQGERRGQDRVRIINRSTDSRQGGTQQVQATEGYPALIQVGQSVPITTYSTDAYGQVYQDSQYRNVTQGFYVTASLTGDRVHLSISSNNDRLSQSQPGAIDVQSTDTRVSGRLGEWISLGGISEETRDDQGGLTQHRATRGRNDMSLRVKVEALD
ncbi:MAG: secretin N-terminal domain-containing protein [Pseudomonas sp.]|uniref:secretin N-terminal domain-containing protein n=1 Tax=Pseudomonas sp. TaxID=306 RepID=UPI0033985DF5